MGRLFRENPSNVRLLGGRLRAGTLRSRVRTIQKFMEWLIAAHGVSLPMNGNNSSSIFKSESQPCVRGALKLVHSSYIFLQEVAGIEDKLAQRYTRCRRRKSLPWQVQGKHRNKHQGFRQSFWVLLKITLSRKKVRCIGGYCLGGSSSSPGEH